MPGSYGLYAQVDGVALATRGNVSAWGTGYFITPTGLETMGLVVRAWDFWQWVNDVQTITWTLVN